MASAGSPTCARRAIRSRSRALTCGELVWSYAELDRITNRLANGLAARGVAILARNSHAFVAMRFALARLGAVLVPINFMLNADAVAYVLRHAGVRLLAIGPDLVDLAHDAIGRDTAVAQVLWLHALPRYHCAQLDVFLGPAIYVGATSIITASPAPDNLLALFARHRATSFFAPPSVRIALLATATTTSARKPRSPAAGSTSGPPMATPASASRPWRGAICCRASYSPRP